MSTPLETISLSELCGREDEILSRLSEKQIPIRKDGRVVAVLVSVDQWNQLVNELEDLDDSLYLNEVYARIEAGEDRWYSHEEVWAEIDDLEKRGELPDSVQP